MSADSRVIDIRAPQPEEIRAAAVGEDSALAYYRSVRQAFSRANQKAGRTDEQHLRIADTAIRLRFVGAGLAPMLLPALSFAVRAESAAHDIEIGLWDRATTGVDVPEPPWRLRDVVARGDVRGLSARRVRAHVDPGGEIITLWDSAERRGIVAVADSARLPYAMRATPLRPILHWALASPARHLLHAAAVGGDGSGALLVGSAGSGKSTTALACMEHGLGYVGDDYVLVETEPSPRAMSVYGTAKLDAPSVSLFPKLPAMRLTNDAQKFVVDVARERPGLMRRSAAITAILLPRVTIGSTCVRSVGPAEALRALAPSTILQHSGESATGMAVMSRLIRNVPAYVLELGSDIAAVGPAVRGVLDQRA